MNAKLIINRKMTKRLARKMYSEGESPIAIAGKRFDFNGKIWVYTAAYYNKSKGEVFHIEAEPIA